MAFDSIPQALACALSAWVFFLMPGQAFVPRAGSAVPTAFARVLASAIVTTLVGTGLAAAGRFSLGALVAGNVVASLGALAFRRPLAGQGPAAPPRDRLGPFVLVLALAAYWPAYPTFLGNSDSTAYIDTGVSLARHGTLYRKDDLGPAVPAQFRPLLFDSMSQVFATGGPPYRRAPGALFTRSLDATRAWPDFFPVPSVWAAAFVLARAPGGPAPEQGAPAYAPVFGALALWAFWILARAWLGRGYGLLAALLLGASVPFYMAARMPLSEVVAAFFAISGLAVLASGGARIGQRDSLLAGAALGAAVFTRIEIGLVLAMALALRPTLARGARGEAGDALPRPFLAALAFVGSLTLVEAALVPGTWTAPLLDHVRNIRIFYLLAWGIPSTALVVSAGAAAVLAVVALARRFGWSATLRLGLVAGILAGHAAAASFLYERTPMWLSFAIGWTGLALAAAGVAAAWTRRASLAHAPLVLSIAAAVVAILFYNPHVYPALPWGWRRFVPLLLPLLVLLATTAIRAAASRSRLLAAAAAAAIAVPVVLGVRAVAGQDLSAGAWESLAQVDSLIPEGGTVLVDRDLSPMMVAPALWLVHDRDNISVPPTGSEGARAILPSLVWHYADKGPVWLVTRGAGDQVRTPLVKMKVVGRTAVSLRLLEQTYDRRPQQIQRYLMPIAVYRLDRSLDRKGGPVK